MNGGQWCIDKKPNMAKRERQITCLVSNKVEKVAGEQKAIRRHCQIGVAYMLENTNIMSSHSIDCLLCFKKIHSGQKYTILSLTFVKTLLPDLYKTKVEQSPKQSEGISLTTKGWTSSYSYMM